MKKRFFLLFLSLSIMTACGNVTPIDEPQTLSTQAEIMEENTAVGSETEETSTMNFAVDTPITGDKMVQSYKVDATKNIIFTSLEKGNEVFMDKKAIAKLYANEENVSSFFAPEHPENADIIFISTSGKSSGKWPDLMNENRIYAYNINIGELELLYEENEPRLLRTVGMNGSKLILMADKIDNSPGPCASIWTADKFEALELANVDAGLSIYSLPASQVELGEKEQSECMQDPSML